MPWRLSWRADPHARAMADRHYNRQTPGALQFVPPGRALVLVADDDVGQAVWVSSWPFAEYTHHAWAGAWMNTLFRNEGHAMRSSDLIRAAVACTCWYWETAPALGMVTFVDASQVRHKRDPGRCYRRAGFVVAGETAGGLLALQLRAEFMPAPEPPQMGQGGLGFAIPSTI